MQTFELHHNTKIDNKSAILVIHSWTSSVSDAQVLTKTSLYIPIVLKHCLELDIDTSGIATSSLLQRAPECSGHA